MMTIAELLPYVTALVAIVGLVYARLSAHRDDAAGLARIADKLDNVGDTVRDTRDDVRDIKRTLDDHGTRIARLEERVNDHGRRLDNLTE